mgnify:CR=1 FL=1
MRRTDRSTPWKLWMCLFGVLLLLPVNVSAFSTGTGNLTLNAGISYDPDTLEWFRGQSTLETWVLSHVNSHPTSGGVVGHVYSSQGLYGDSNIAGWDKEPLPFSGAFAGNTVSTTNDHSAPLTPSGQSSITFDSRAFSDYRDAYTYSNIMYFANLHATGNGSFTFYIDYAGTWNGTTTSLGDWLNLDAEIQGRVDKMTYDANGGFIDWGTTITSERRFERVSLNDIDSGFINNFSGTFSLTVDYTADDYFYMRVDNISRISGYSEDVAAAPVPEPSTIFLLGCGLVGLIWYGRNRNNA